jgi:excisionase family DNA binding protein
MWLTLGLQSGTRRRVGVAKQQGIKPMSQKSTASGLEGRVKTLDEVAVILRIARGSAYEAAKRGEIPTIRIGRRLLVPSVALERLLSGKTGE